MGSHSVTPCCCQGLETRGRGQGLEVPGPGQGQGVKLQGQGQGQGFGPALIHTFLDGTEQEVMSLVVYCHCQIVVMPPNTDTH